MAAETLLAFNIALLAALVSPGPALLLSLRTTLLHGARGGMLTGLGLGTMAALWTAAALLGLDALFAVFPFAYTAFKIIGAVYLLWIAFTTWRHATAPQAAAPTPQRGALFRGGVLMNLANPKSVLFAAAVLVVIFPPDLSLGAKALIVLNHAVVEWIAYGAFALLLSTDHVSRRYLAAKPIFDRIAAAVMGALGLRLLLER